MNRPTKYRLSVRKDGLWNVLDRDTGGPAEVESGGRWFILFGLPKADAEVWSRRLNKNPK